MVLLRRLLEAGADDRMWPTQYGFRRKRGTEDALHCARRSMELAWSQRNGRMHVMALDWKKAFDSISPESLLQALRRFGIPEAFVRMIKSVCTDRVFHVRECGITSDTRSQHAGICQGCPLSPFLFGIVMTILMDSARKLLSPAARHAVGAHQLFDILYADDTMLLGTQTAHVEELAAAIETVGAEFGMTLHWGKTQAMSICSDMSLRGPDGSVINDKGSLIYLGGLLTADGRADSEVSRRIGAAAGEFRRLQKMWGHTGISRCRKLELFNALVASKLLYDLSTLWVVPAQKRRLDGFYCRCLRRILNIPSAYICRISNKIVLRKAGVIAFSEQLCTSN